MGRRYLNGMVRQDQRWYRLEEQRHGDGSDWQRFLKQLEHVEVTEGVRAPAKPSKQTEPVDSTDGIVFRLGPYSEDLNEELGAMAVMLCGSPTLPPEI